MKKVNLWPTIKKLLLRYVTKVATSRLGLTLGGFQASVLLWVAEKAIDWILEPVYLNAVLWVEKKRNVKKGKQQSGEVINAQTDDETTDAFDNLG